MSKRLKYFYDEEDLKLPDDQIKKISSKKTKRICGLIGKWIDLNDNRMDYSTGEKEFDVESFKKLLKETSIFRREFRDKLSNAIKNSKLNRVNGLITNEIYLTSYDLDFCLHLQEEILRYAGNMKNWERETQDKSNDYVFTASRLLADTLAEYFSMNVVPFDEDGTILIKKEDYKTIELLDNEEKFAFYNIKKGDMGEVLDLAKRMNSSLNCAVS